MRAIAAIACAGLFCGSPAAAQTQTAAENTATAGPVILADENGARPVVLVPLTDETAYRGPGAASASGSAGSYLPPAAFNAPAARPAVTASVESRAPARSGMVGGAELTVSR